VEFALNDKKRFACIECGLELPISLTSNPHAGERFHCSYCGAVYCGILDKDAPQDLHSNIRQSKRPENSR